MELLPIVTVRGDGTFRELWEARCQLPAHLQRGRTVRQILDEADPGLTVTVPLDERARQILSNAAELPGNASLKDVAARGRVQVDVSCLAECDPDEAAIVGFELSWTKEEVELLGLDRDLPQREP